MVDESKMGPALRQKIRKALLILSFVLLPVTFVYISCPISTGGASQGIATGGLFVFTLLFIGSLFFGRLWCGYLCPAGGLQEIYFGLNSTRFKIGWLNWLKYPVFLGIYGSIALAIYSSGVFQPSTSSTRPAAGSRSTGRADTPFSTARLRSSPYSPFSPDGGGSATVSVRSRSC
ncbi:MAG: ferredoxin-type protein NapH [Methanoculleus sp.]|nr:ferredoxin-type protein NapH [Methanoculleus sp.]MDK2989485.1 ferredoxin-type protein NapH [Methanoculleus sp.]